MSYCLKTNKIIIENEMSSFNRASKHAILFMPKLRRTSRRKSKMGTMRTSPCTRMLYSS